MTKTHRIIITTLAALALLLAIAGLIGVGLFGGHSDQRDLNSSTTDVEDGADLPASWTTRPTTESELQAALDNQGFAGLVERVSPHEIVLVSIDGESRRFALSEGVTVYRGFIQETEIPLADVKAGASVQVSYRASTGEVSEIWVD